MTLNCNGQLLTLDTPRILGVLNITPDSFYDGGAYLNVNAAIKQCEKMITEGVDIIDLGAYSSRPGAKEITENEELSRLLPVLEQLKSRFPNTLFSIDTFRSKVAQEALDRGASMINDISAGKLDPNMIRTVAQYPVPYIAMHMQGTPDTMQNNPSYVDIFAELIHFFSNKIDECYAAGINDVIIDPGFGFGKTIENNYEILQRFERFQQFNVPVLAGVSRKSMIYKTLEVSTEEALNGTTVLNTYALIKKAQFLRVHDVKEAKECITLLQRLQ